MTMAKNLLLLVISLCSYITLSLAQSTTTVPSISQTAAASTNVFSQIAAAHPTDDHGDPAGSVGGDTSGGVQGQNSAGAAGSDQNSINLSTGAQVGIIISVALVVIIGVGSAILFLLAKKRQWAVRESIRRSARRLTRRGNPTTPPPVFPKGDRGMIRIDPPSKNRVPQLKTPMSREQLARAERQRDVEKGLGNSVQVHAIPAQSTFEMDSPATTRQGGAWKKMFGGR